ncbi:type VI secretion-associated protein [Chromobacterium haemolyticum]|uniref:type VI secretion system protein TssA n=1 Tax=Chromobacterium haemolyticum TaxID=394935 RepID=UPI0005BC13E8|nr:type VI secretion system protein TssA [Chromobacterium haemolyticum]MDH0344476.1 type VI secretion system protein TssA [Chromobacterium haemolyticum]OQS32228.1 type VI secretion-associated protein [Chromobacterium haemolyticum]
MSWLRALLGRDTAPEEEARQRLPRWSAWLKPISDASPCGEDLSHDDEFLALKEEATRLSGMNAQLALAHAETLLKTRGKDLRVAAYYAFTRLRQDGVAGLADGLELSAALLERYPDTVWPRQPARRRNALEWLASERFTNQLSVLADDDDAAWRRAAAALLLVQRLSADSEAPPQRLETLGRCLQPRLQAADAGHAAMDMPVPAAVGAATPPAGADEVGSWRELLEQARRMAVFLRQQPEGQAAALRLLRAVRWEALSSPPPGDADGRSRLPPPRAELRQQLKRLLLQQQWRDLSERVESAFAEGANHWWLDLQRYAWLARQHDGEMGAPLAELIRDDVQRLCQRLPGVEKLSFSDGSPFAEDATLEWLAQWRRPETSVLAAPAADERGDWPETETQAHAIAAQQGLPAAFAWVQALPAIAGGREFCLRQLLLARLAERHGRAEMAIHLLEALLRQADGHQLDIWEPQLAFELLAQLARLLRQRMQRKDADRSGLAQQLEQLNARLAALDPARALAGAFS